jgi:alkylation response protein AidB-like acyl-CoA dehydrogenase
MPDVEIEQFRREARAWLEANMEPRPRASHLGSSDSRTPEEIAASRILQRKLFDGGWAGITYPTEYGGRGLTAAHERAFREEALGYVLPDFGGAGHVMFGAIGRSLLAHASPAFLGRHIARLLSGEELWCQFYSEPEAGSDLAGIRTSATRDGDRWLLRGSKIWSTGADHADYAMCLARTDWNAPKHQGLTWFAVPTNAKGLTIRPIVQINGAAGFCEEFLDDVEVTDDDIIGEVNRGWTVAQTMLVYERGAGNAGAVPVEPRRLAPDLVALAGRSAATTRWQGSSSPAPT